MQFPYVGGMESGCHWSAQSFAVQPSVGQASSSSFPQNFPFKLGEERQKAGHGAASGRGQIQRLGQ